MRPNFVVREVDAGQTSVGHQSLCNHLRTGKPWGNQWKDHAKFVETSPTQSRWKLFEKAKMPMPNGLSSFIQKADVRQVDAFQGRVDLQSLCNRLAEVVTPRRFCRKRGSHAKSCIKDYAHSKRPHRQQTNKKPWAESYNPSDIPKHCCANAPKKVQLLKHGASLHIYETGLQWAKSIHYPKVVVRQVEMCHGLVQFQSLCNRTTGNSSVGINPNFFLKPPMQM